MKKSSLVSAVCYVLGVTMCGMSGVAAGEQAKASNSWYVGGGLGITELDPDTGNSGYTVSDQRDTGIKLFAGYDFTEEFSAEVFYSDLGAAGLSSDFVTLPDGEISYSTIGASALWYFWRQSGSDADDPRKGWQAYLHGGLSFLDNSSSSGINYTQDNSTQISYGAAVEYGFDNGFAVRAGLDLYDKDAGMALVSVLKRFGTRSSRKAIEQPQAKPEPVVEVPPVIEPAAVATPVVVPVVAPVVAPEAVVEVDTDKDGVIDSLDNCSDSPAQFSVDDKGCSIIDLDFAGVEFEPKSFELTKASKALLDEAVITINLSPELQKIEVSAHTDYKGSGSSNMALSEKRAAAVKDYLVSRGVSEKRLVAKGYGESQPIASNRTEEGRARNRRVELKVLEDESATAGNSTTSSPVEKQPSAE